MVLGWLGGAEKNFEVSIMISGKSVIRIGNIHTLRARHTRAFLAVSGLSVEATASD